MSKILDADAYSLAEQIKKKELTATDVVRTYIAHQKKINPILNCVVEDRYEEALKEAMICDQTPGEKKRGKLFGVPLSIKEAFHLAGMKTTGGLPARKEIVEAQDAQIVKQLKAEGAIFLSKTNTPALCFCQETENKLYGLTRNPWDLGKTAGGSSGGEGSLLAAGGAAVGIGSDIGGSIRFPSHFNGVIGFKSGKGQISIEGAFPPVEHPLQQRMFGIGAMGKSVRDARLIHEILTKDQIQPKSVSEYTINIPSITQFPIGEATQQMLLQIKKILENHFHLTDETPPYFEDSAMLWQLIMSIEGAKEVAKIAVSGRKTSPLFEYLKERTSRNSEIHPYLSWALIGAQLFKPNQQKLNQLSQTLHIGDSALNTYLENQLIILPVYHSPALPHGQIYKEIFSIRKTYLKYVPFIAYANTWGLPSLTIPVGTDENNLPIGLQIISKNGNEEAIFQLGEIFEKETRGYIRCTKYDK